MTACSRGKLQSDVYWTDQTLFVRSDLHRFLADTLEYRARLSEIRDGVLGVERRRKGMWRVVRTVAMDWLEEEESGMGVGQGGEAYE